eukprot:TRINITY_DN3778_c0_g1_i9.p1 TRINITY_DN3778_c0_g1~~TRINITY_DN3778_c0_g1_i9.p1  ORF type:complete len:287 (+),score=26.16 TRINITY_DN3778_c0_g1_i9:44-862(+)
MGPVGTVGNGTRDGVSEAAVGTEISESMGPVGTVGNGTRDGVSEAAEAGIVPARGVVVGSHGKGWRFGGKALHRALVYYRRGAALGDARAQHKLGSCYMHGDGVDVDYVEAMKWLTRASEGSTGLCQNEVLGDAELICPFRRAKSDLLLAMCYEYGHGVELDPEKALSLYESAASAGYPNALNSLGMHYSKGVLVPQDHSKAFRLWTSAVQLDEEQAGDFLYNLAWSYERGRGVEQNSARASELYTKAAKRGQPLARRWMERRAERAGSDEG